MEMTMRVAMVTARCVPFMGGIETHVQEVAPRLGRGGIDLTVFTTDVTGALPREEEFDGFTVRRFPAWPPKRDYYFSAPLVRALRADQFDLVHIQGVHALLPPLALAAAARAKIPSILTFHTGGSSSPLRTAVRSSQWRTLAPLLRTTRRLVAVCEYEQELFCRTLRLEPTRIPIVRNGAVQLPESGELPDVSGDPLVLTIGRLERYKGHHRALAAMPALLRRSPGARLVIVGSGPYESRLRSRVDELGIGREVAFMSFAPRERSKLGALIRRADAVALLSEYEAHPVAVMEALALGCDVVCADTSGLTELGRDGLVRTVGIDASPETVADAIIAAVNERRWKERPPALSTWDQCADALVETYREALSCAS
jgi:glycosyltransferase involved in cell wall biosynthesis